MATISKKQELTESFSCIWREERCIPPHLLFLTMVTEKNYFAQFGTRMNVWLLLIFFICLHNQLSSIHSITTFKEFRYLKNMIHQIDSKNE